jgi:UDP-GlcNAc:undecaprenyl-phosphate GlcNAc-1-phosphate transferase
VPILDVAFSFVRRLVKRQHWHQADAGHLHHRLMRLGHGQRRTVAMLWAWTALLSAVALVPTYTKEGNAIVPFVAAGLALLLYAVFHPGVRGAREKQVRAAHPTSGTGSDAVVDLEERRRQRA